MRAILNTYSNSSASLKISEQEECLVSIYYNYKDRIFGGIYDNRLLVKPVKAAEDHLKDITFEMPYEGAKPMYLVDNTDDKEYLKGLVEAMYEQLPPPRSKKK